MLRQSQSGLNSSQYIRLISLAGADVVFGLPLNLYFLVRAAQTARPWLGWAKVHEEWSQVLHFTAAVMIRDDEGMVLRMLSKYLCPMLAIIFFLFFGVSEDSLSEYERWGRQIKRVLRLDSPKKVAEELVRAPFTTRSSLIGWPEADAPGPPRIGRHWDLQ